MLLNLASVNEYFDYHANCTWRGRTNGDFLYLKSEDGGATYFWEVTWNGKLYKSAALAPPLDCLTQSYELPGEGETVTLTPAGDRCQTCGCVCTNCGETVTGYNAPCCVRAEFSGFLNGTCTDCDLANRRVWLRKTGDCTWEATACGVCASNWTVKLTIAASSISVQYGSYTFSAPWSPGPGQTCCWEESAPFTIGNPAGGPECNVDNAVVKLVGYEEEKCACNANCVMMTPSGVRNHPGHTPTDCPCASCTVLNRGTSLRPAYSDRCEWIGTVCSQPADQYSPIGDYEPCGRYHATRIWWEGNDLYAGIWATPATGNGTAWVKWKATFPPGWPKGDIDGALLNYDSGAASDPDLWGSCDFTQSSVTLSTFEDDCDCGVKPCLERTDEPFKCGCTDDAWPNEYWLIIPNGFSERDISGTYMIPVPVDIGSPACGIEADINTGDGCCNTCAAPAPRPLDRVDIVPNANAGPGYTGAGYIILWYWRYWPGGAPCFAVYYDWLKGSTTCTHNSNGEPRYGWDCSLQLPENRVADLPANVNEHRLAFCQGTGCPNWPVDYVQSFEIQPMM